MIDFSTLQGLTIPEGVVTQITDASGRVIWAVQRGTRAVLQVAKQTLNTYAGETEYTGEEFILLDIYPKTNGTVKVTYGGLTKTITDTSGAEEPNAQQVFFGTFNGVADSVVTPASGELVIEGSFREFAVGEYNSGVGSGGKLNTAYCGCITVVNEWGEITSIPTNGFANCQGIVTFVVPEGIVSVGNGAFENCGRLSHIIFPTTLKTLGSSVVWKTINTAGYVPYTVKMLATTPPTFTVTSNFNFIQTNGDNSGNIIVPKGCGEAYKSAVGWSEYAEYITEES